MVWTCHVLSYPNELFDNHHPTSAFEDRTVHDQQVLRVQKILSGLLELFVNQYLTTQPGRLMSKFYFIKEINDTPPIKNLINQFFDLQNVKNLIQYLKTQGLCRIILILNKLRILIMTADTKINRSLEIIRWAGVALGIFFAFYWGNNPQSQFSIFAIFSVIFLAGITAIESMFFGEGGAEVSGYGEGW